MSAPIFISHASENGAIAERIVAYLESKGAPCWISSRDISPKEIYAEAITQAMREAQSCLVIVSAPANSSAAVKRELELASRYNKPFIPVRIDATEPGPGLDYYLNNTQWVDYGRDKERALDRVVGAYAARTGASAPTPAQAPPARAATRTPLLIVAALAAIGVAWLAWTQLIPQQDATNEGVGDYAAASALVGAYHWDGVACGQGPAIAQADDTHLAVTMANTPAFRHEITQIQSNTDGYALIVQTRVTEPAAQAGETYTLRQRGEALEVISGGRTDVWDRCTVEAAAETQTPSTGATPAAAAQSLVGSWSGPLTWGDGAPFEAAWLFHENGTVTAPNAEGAWVQEGASVSWTLRSGARYSGRLERGSITGTAVSDDGATGRFTLRRR